VLRWGILGTSTAVGQAVAPALREAGHDLAVVGSRSRSRAQQFAASQGVRRARGSYDDVVASDDVDCVYMALPNALHEDWAVAALKAGKHVLCAKPLATSAEAARRMAAAAAATNRVLMEARWPRAHPRTEALLELAREGELGTVRAITATLGSTPAGAHDVRLDPTLGGGALLDAGGDQVAVSRWLVGEEPDAVGGVGRLAATGVDAATALSLRFPGGATAVLHAALDVASVDELTVVGSHAWARLPRAFAPPRDEPAVLERSHAAPAAFDADGVTRTLQRFASAVAEGAAPPLPIADAIATAEVLDRARGG
jgi:predicted dehydrogenase